MTPDPAPGARPLRFLVVGGLNTAFGLAVYPALLWSFKGLAAHYLVALLIAQAICLGVAFAMHKLFVFRTRGNVAAEALAFLSYYAGIYAVNWAALPALVELCGLRPSVAQIGFTLLTVAGSYVWHSRVTFRPAPLALQRGSRQSL